MRKLALPLLAIVVAISGGWATAALLQSRSGPEVPVREVSGIPQDARASDQGITLHVTEAAFSGTRTELLLEVSFDQAGLPPELSAREITRVIPAHDGFAPAAFAGDTLEVGAMRNAQLVVTLPPIDPAAVANDTLQLQFTAMSARVPEGSVRVEGVWALELRTPPQAELAAVLRTEQLTPATVEMAGKDVAVRARRSVSETLVELDVPEDVTLLGLPLLRTDGRRIAPLQMSKVGAATIIAYPATDFGTSVEVELGTIGLLAGGSAPTFTIDVGAAIARAGGVGKDESFDIDAGDVLAGDSGLIVSGRVGDYGDGRFIAIGVAGAWHPTEDAPMVYDASGKQLRRGGVQTGYTKDPEGNVSPGVTEVSFYPSARDVGTITLVMGPATTVEPGGTLVTLSP